MPECRFLSPLLLLLTLWSAAARESAALPFIAEIRQQHVIFPRDGSLARIWGGELRPPASIPVPAGLRVFLASGKDFRVIREAPERIPVRQWMLAGGVTTVFALILLQVRSLRRQVRIGAAALAEAGVQRRAAEARAEERQRLTEEIHDIMAQSLTGVALQLGAADLARISAPAEVPRHLKLASGLLDFTRDEIRRTLLDLRSGLLDRGDLAGSLKNMAEMFVKTGGCGVEWEIIGVPSHVHPLTVHSLLRVIQEGMTNALTHGRATRIDIRVDYSPPGGISIVLRDNGQGSSSCTRPGPADGHFGLESMRGRIRRLGGNFKFTSQPGKGAIVEASIPLQPDSPPCNSTSSAADYSSLAVSGAAAATS
ncbi:MAG: ATP-binding protein [Verrucomicrobiota bacterium]